MDNLGSMVLRNLTVNASSQAEAANMVVEMLRAEMGDDRLPSSRSVMKWLKGEALPRDGARRALHALGVGWGLWLIPANIGETMLMSPPER